MPEQYGNKSSMGLDFSMLVGNLFQQHKKDLWTKEKSYWQKFLTAEQPIGFANPNRFLPQKAKPTQEFFQLWENMTAQNNQKKQKLPLSRLPGDEGIKKAGDTIGLWGNNKKNTSVVQSVYQTYLTQQVRKYLYQNQNYYQRQSQYFQTNGEGAVTRQLLNMELPVTTERESHSDRLPSVEDLNGKSFTQGETQWKEEAILPDYGILLSGMQNKMMESLTELLQNMIPEMEGM